MLLMSNFWAVSLIPDSREINISIISVCILVKALQFYEYVVLFLCMLNARFTLLLFTLICHIVLLLGVIHLNYLINCLTLLQEKAIRLVNNSSYLAHCYPIAYKLSILFIYDIYCLKYLLYMYQIVYHYVNLSLCSQILYLKDTVNYNLQNANNLSAIRTIPSL